jgi:hypothetical protein
MEKIKTIMGMFLDGNNTSNEKQEDVKDEINQQPEYSQDEEPIAKITPIGKPYENNMLGFNLNNPETISKISRVFEVMNTKDDKRINLIMSLRPFLGQARNSKLDHAVKMLQVSKLSNLMKK